MPLTAAGYTPRTQAEIAQRLAQRLGSSLGITIAVDDPTDPLGRLCQALAAELAEVSLTTAAAFTAWNPQTGQGTQLDRILAAFGSMRRAAASATVRVRLVGTPTLDLTGYVAKDPDGGLWVLPAGSVVGALGDVFVTATAADTGSMAPALGAWTLSGIAPAGFTSVTALQQLSDGDDGELDPAVRTRIALLLSAGKGTEAAIYAALYLVAGVDTAALRIYNNRENIVSPQGVPPHSVEALVTGGAATEIATALLGSASHVAAFFGATSAEGSFTLDDGTTITREVRYTVPYAFRAYARATVIHTGAPEDLPADAEDQVAQAIADYTDTLIAGAILSGAEAASRVVQVLPAQTVISVVVEFADDPAGPWSGSLLGGYRVYPRVTNEPTGAQIVGTKTGTFAITAGWQLDLNVDGGSTQSVVFPNLSGDAQDVADVINTAVDDMEASDVGGYLQILGDLAGAGHTIEIEGTSTGALLTALGLTAGTYFGRDSDVDSVTIL